MRGNHPGPPRYDHDARATRDRHLERDYRRVFTGIRDADREPPRARLPMSYGFQQTLEQIRAESGSQAGRGALFERLMKRYFREDPLYADRFSDVRLRSE